MKDKTTFLLLKFALRNFLFTLFSFLIILSNSILAGELRLTASNHLEYVTANEDDREIFHDWFDYNLSYDIYNLGLRYETHNPDDWGKDTLIFPFWYFQLSPEFLELTLGNYYALFGRGLILRSYENRDLRHDNNLEGAKGTIHLDDFDLTLLGGTPRGGYERINDPLYAADGKINLFDEIALGGSYLQTDITDFGLVQLYGGNINLALPHLDLYAEYAIKDNPAGEFIEEDGRGIYLSSNMYFTGFGLSLEYKDYKRFDFTHGEVTYNNPPSLAKEHLYTLLNRKAYVLNLYDEKGLQAQAITTPHEQLNLLTNCSYTTDHKNKLIFSEIYAEMEYDYNNLATIKAGFSRLKNDKEEGSPYYLAPIFDFTFYLSEQNSLAFLLEHLWTNKYDGKLTYYDQIISLSFSYSPFFSLTLTHERTSEWKTREWSGRKNWYTATLDWSLFKRHNLSLSMGFRRAGKVCAGGICTEKPALDGAEIKLLSQF